MNNGYNVFASFPRRPKSLFAFKPECTDGIAGRFNVTVATFLFLLLMLLSRVAHNICICYVHTLHTCQLSSYSFLRNFFPYLEIPIRIFSAAAVVARFATNSIFCSDFTDLFPISVL